MADDDLAPMDLSPSERAVVFRMRQSDRMGSAIFKYAMKWSDEKPDFGRLEPFRQ